MFAKTLLSVLALGIVIVGLLQIFNGGGYLVFAIGMVLYFLASVASSFCKKNRQLIFYNLCLLRQTTMS